MKKELKESLKESMKAKDKVRTETIRALLSEIQYEEIQKGVEDLDSEGCLAIAQRELKKRKEEGEFAQKADRTELLEKIALEMAVLESFLPKQLSSEAIEREFQKMKTENSGLQMGLAMKQLKERFPGQFDGKSASEIAKKVFVNP